MAVRESPSSAESAQPQPTDSLPPLSSHRLVRSGAYAWALIGILGLAVAVVVVVGQLKVVVVPLVLALFPAAVLTPFTRRLISRGVPRSVAALIALLLTVGLVTAVVVVLAPQFQRELGDVGANLRQGYTRVQEFLAAGPFGLSPIQLDEVTAQIQTQIGRTQGVSQTVLKFAGTILEGVVGFFFFLFALFFYLKDGAKIAGWLRDLFPRAAQADAEHIGGLVWHTIGRYIRGQMFIAFSDAALIGVGLVILRVPLALPLAVFVFFGALFPVVGAIVAGTVAVLVALATVGLGKALLVLALILVAFQVEGHLLSPIVLGRITRLHPLAVVAALTAGGVLLGVLGAFLAVPVAASVARALGYLRDREAGAVSRTAEGSAPGR
ncbi:MAG: AI-2E family transporter [Egibacteraceae bacterium]